MIHPINPAAEVALRNVVAFQRKVLNFATSITLTVPLYRDEIDAHFGTQAAWLWTHTSLHAPIVALHNAVRADPSLSAKVLSAFDNDVAFDTHTDDPAFTFGCGRLNCNARKLVRDLLVRFYDLLGRDQGFSTEITGGDGLNRQDFVQEFWRVNPTLKVCPACDGPRPDKADGRIRAQCDHHFPKSVHAALSVHPRNLIPLCLDCNITFKGERDANDRASLSEMFLPYTREAFGPLEVRAFRDTRGTLALEMSDGGRPNTRRIEALDYILGLRARWTDRLGSRVSESIVNNLRRQSRTAARLGDSVADRLENISVQKEGYRTDRGRQHDSILLEAYCALLEADASELDEVFG